MKNRKFKRQFESAAKCYGYVSMEGHHAPTLIKTFDVNTGVLTPAKFDVVSIKGKV